MNSHSPKSVFPNIHLPYVSSPNPKSYGASKNGIAARGALIKKHNTQYSIQYQQMDMLNSLSPTQSSKGLGRGLLSSISKSPNSPHLKKDNFLSKNNENDNINSTSSINLLRQINSKTSFNIPSIYNKKKLQKNEVSKIAVKSSSLPKIGRNIISIRCESNWENTSQIALYFISLVDKSNHQINPFNNVHPNEDDDNSQSVYIASLPEPTSLENLEKLLNSSYLKNDQGVFCENFDDQKLTIFLSIHNSIDIGGIRIFNPPAKNRSAVKDVTIYVNNDLCCKGEIPQNFGVNLKCNISPEFIYSDRSARQSQPSFNISDGEEQVLTKNHSIIPRTIVHKDKFGILPTTPITELKIEIVETYNGIIKLGEQEISKCAIKNQNYVGINGFDILDLFGNPIYTKAVITESNPINQNDDLEIGSIKDVNIRGISQLINCGMLLKPDKKTNAPEDMLLGEMDRTQYPTFIFTFTQPTCVSKILIWNYNGSEENLLCGVRKLKIYTNNQLFWFGKIPCCDGKITNMIKSVYSIQLYEQIPNLMQITL